jgi:hypothetical protein
MSEEAYHIPANFTDAGRLLGLFELRNAIEAVILGIPMLLLGLAMPFGLTAKIIVTLALFVPAAGFALIGLGDDCLSRYFQARRRWRKKKRIITYRGSVAL